MKNDIRLLDLFCGAGGLSLGFERHGFKVVKALDFAKHAIDTYNLNRKQKVAEVKDIKTVDEAYISALGRIDGIIGGPPCQGFSTAGQRIIDDDRNVLYREYFKILGAVKPAFFVIENVVGILTFAKGAIVNDIARRAKELGYVLHREVLNAIDYGVPQLRRRVIFVGIREGLEKIPFEFPIGKPCEITIQDAIGDLPSLDNGDDNTRYPSSPNTDYQKYIRNGCRKLTNHQQSAHTDEVKETLRLIPQGGSVMDIPETKRGGRQYHALLRKMNPAQPSLCIDTGHRTYFHYKELRVPSVRECARLQSFTDDYVFCGPKQEQYRQVGNAVPPLLASAIACQVMKSLRG